MTLARSALALALVAATTSPAFADDDEARAFWPQWRGPDGSGTAPEADPPIRWSETENVLWKRALPGRGSSTPVVWGDRLYLTTAVPVGREGRPAGGLRGADTPQRYTVIAVDAATGEVAWEKVVREQVPAGTTHPDGTWASASPITDGERVWAFFGSQGLYCLTTGGEIVWQKDFGDMHARRGFGEGATPLLHGDDLLVQWDEEGPSFLAALDKRTGEERWRTPRDEITNWASPHVVELEDGSAQVVTAGTNRTRGYDLATGAPLWEAEGQTLNAIPSPVHHGERAFVTSGYRGSVLLAIDLAGARGDIDDGEALAWKLDRDTPYVPSPLLYDGALYFLKSNAGVLTVVDVETGAPLYGPTRIDARNVYASPVAAAGRVYLASREGDTVVLRHGPELDVITVNQLDDGFDASPVPVGDVLYLRGQRHLYAIAER